MAIRHDSAFRASDAYSPVNARKKGLPPSGSTMGKSAVRTRNKLFAASSIVPVAIPLKSLRATRQVLFGSATSSRCKVNPCILLRLLLEIPRAVRLGSA